MSKSFKALGLAVSALALTHLPAAAQTKVTNDGISATEIVIGRLRRAEALQERAGATKKAED